MSPASYLTPNLGPQLAPRRYLSRLELAGCSLQDQVQTFLIPSFEPVKQNRSRLSQERQGFARELFVPLLQVIVFRPFARYREHCLLFVYETQSVVVNRTE